jgi:hypothetical protein
LLVFIFTITIINYSSAGIKHFHMTKPISSSFFWWGCYPATVMTMYRFRLFLLSLRVISIYDSVSNNLVYFLYNSISKRFLEIITLFCKRQRTSLVTRMPLTFSLRVAVSLITLLLIVLLLSHTKFSLFTAVKIVLMKQLLSSYHKYPAACNKTRAKLVLLHWLDSFLISLEGIWTTARERKGWSGWELAVPFSFHSCTLDRSG